MTKEKYEAPAMEPVGSFEELTKAASVGNATDAMFSVDTPKGDLTFS